MNPSKSMINYRTSKDNQVNVKQINSYTIIFSQNGIIENQFISENMQNCMFIFEKIYTFENHFFNQDSYIQQQNSD